MYVASDRSRAQSPACTTVRLLMLLTAAWQLTSGRCSPCSGGRYVCMWHCGQRCQYQIAHAWPPGHSLASM